ncbi:MAG: 50S ribosomal protein L24 [Candidatus Komeilibacteria bacterium RIFCSPLOWO2_01_FULL_45_10]|uniref:Large ribosomal subunit protein uL24 n=1 Tax=Candidatus Komeilibacteria bacterium RIFCSPLOWO2_01_FULL_45_10 TaxID=1798550 RepID=A0A1G2BKL7_9BACT|nr:MAG: 50S ribosomal protein L24 [Candidatus Komeilibacteria bacterium RIFCSPLOWO2_01_FULL_45_10]
MKIKKGDTVKIISGKDKGKTGKIIQIFPEANKVVVEGANTHWRHLKPRKQGEKGQRVEYAAPLHVAKVMLIDPKTGRETRIGYKMLATGEKVRIAKRSGEVV